MFNQYDYITELESNKFSHRGKLILSENLNKVNYGIMNESAVTFDSITDFLNKIYNSPTPFIKLNVKNFTDNRSCYKMGKLSLKEDSNGILDWHIDEFLLDLEDFQLGKQLYEWGEKEIGMFILHLNDAKDGSQDEQTTKAS